MHIFGPFFGLAHAKNEVKPTSSCLGPKYFRSGPFSVSLGLPKVAKPQGITIREANEKTSPTSRMAPLTATSQKVGECRSLDRRLETPSYSAVEHPYPNSETLIASEKAHPDYRCKIDGGERERGGIRRRESLQKFSEILCSLPFRVPK